MTFLVLALASCGLLLLFVRVFCVLPIAERNRAQMEAAQLKAQLKAALTSDG